MKFEVGDLVARTTKPHQASGMKIGELGTVTNIQSRNHMELDGNKDYVYDPDYFMLVKRNRISRDEMIKGEVYVGCTKNLKIIFIENGNEKTHHIDNNENYRYDFCCSSPDIVFREANDEEKAELLFYITIINFLP